MAMSVLENETVNSEVWSEAVEWLLLYGTPEIKDLILQASGMATNECFPELRAAGFTDDGQPCYDVKDLANALGISEEEVAEKMSSIEEHREVGQLFDKKQTYRIQ